MSSISSRLAKLEFTQRPAPPDKDAAKAFWEEHLPLLSDAQLDRLEEITIAHGGGQDRPMDELFRDVTGEESADLQSIFATMGIEWPW
ncbi:MAG: hypothetical protein Devi2KO_14970 [Devosia indica]